MKLEYLPNYSGEYQTKTVLDRTRLVSYNGNPLDVNTYKCSDCRVEYFFEETPHKFCPFCGIEYKYKTDVSI